MGLEGLPEISLNKPELHVKPEEAVTELVDQETAAKQEGYANGLDWTCDSLEVTGDPRPRSTGGSK